MLGLSVTIAIQIGSVTSWWLKEFRRREQLQRIFGFSTDHEFEAVCMANAYLALLIGGLVALLSLGAIIAFAHL